MKYFQNPRKLIIALSLVAAISISSVGVTYAAVERERKAIENSGNNANYPDMPDVKNMTPEELEARNLHNLPPEKKAKLPADLEALTDEEKAQWARGEITVPSDALPKTEEESWVELDVSDYYCEFNYVITDADGEEVESGMLALGKEAATTGTIPADGCLTISPAYSTPTGWCATSEQRFSFAYTLDATSTIVPEVRETAAGFPGTVTFNASEFGQNTANKFAYGVEIPATGFYSVTLHNIGDSSVDLTSFEIAYHNSSADALTWINPRRP